MPKLQLTTRGIARFVRGNQALAHFAGRRDGLHSHTTQLQSAGAIRLACNADWRFDAVDDILDQPCSSRPAALSPAGRRALWIGDRKLGSQETGSLLACKQLLCKRSSSPERESSKWQPRRPWPIPLWSTSFPPPPPIASLGNHDSPSLQPPTHSQDAWKHSALEALAPMLQSEALQATGTSGDFTTMSMVQNGSPLLLLLLLPLPCSRRLPVPAAVSLPADNVSLTARVSLIAKPVWHWTSRLPGLKRAPRPPPRSQLYDLSCSTSVQQARLACSRTETKYASAT